MFPHLNDSCHTCKHAQVHERKWKYGALSRVKWCLEGTDYECIYKIRDGCVHIDSYLAYEHTGRVVLSRVSRTSCACQICYDIVRDSFLQVVRSRTPVTREWLHVVCPFISYASQTYYDTVRISHVHVVRYSYGSWLERDCMSLVYSYQAYFIRITTEFVTQICK